MGYDYRSRRHHWIFTTQEGVTLPHSVAPGTYRVRAAKGERRSEVVEAKVDLGESVTARVVLPE